MKKSNIIIFVVIIVVVVAIFGYAMWNMNRELNELKNQNNQQQANSLTNSAGQTTETTNPEENANIVGQENNNEINPSNNGNSGNTGTNTENQNNGNSNNGALNNNAMNYIGDWYISQEAYTNAEEIDRILDRREDNLITDEEFQSQMNSSINTNIAELDVERYTGNQIRFDFTLTSPAPTQREAKLDDIMVNLTNGIGTFTYTDNWGTSGNGTITLKDNQIELKLETTSAAQGALWGVEGIYTFSYKRID